MKDIKTVIAKLHAHAESSKKVGNAREAAAFAAKAMALADKHGLDYSEASRAESDMVIVPFPEVKYYQKRYAGILAKLYGVAGIISTVKRNNTFIELSGRLEHVEMVKVLFTVNYDVVDGAMKKALKKYKLVNPTRGQIEAFRGDFYLGVAAGMTKRIQAARDEFNAGLREVISLEHQAGLEHFQKEVGGTKQSSKKKVGRTAYNAGKKSASKINAGKGLSGGAKRLN